MYIGFDPREVDAFAVARASMRRHLVGPIPIHGLVLSSLQGRGLYKRPTERVDGRLIDVLSRRSDYDGSISTQHAIARFLVPFIHGRGLALFADGDILVRKAADILFDQAARDPSKALWCVKHDYRPTMAVKMDSQVQTAYPRKNWSSVCLWNTAHPAHDALTIERINTVPGRDLHAFDWLADDQIGDLDLSWNWLAGESNPGIDPGLVHFTAGIPSMPGYEDAPFADEWRAELARWAA